VNHLEDIARQLIDLGLSPLFEAQTGTPLPPELGPELARTVRARLLRAGLVDPSHCEEVLSWAVLKVCRYLDRHSAAEIREPRAYFHKVCRTEVLRQVQRVKMEAIREAGPGEGEELGVEETAPIVSEEQILQTVRSAIAKLSPRFRRFLWLDLVELRSPEEICRAMGFYSLAYFKKVKSLAFSALRDSLKGG